jgi:hypothetical protein
MAVQEYDFVTAVRYLLPMLPVDDGLNEQL